MTSSARHVESDAATLVLERGDKVPRHILPAIVVAQFAATALWFATNAVIGDLVRAGVLAADALGTLSSAVQLGFIAGTLSFAVALIADRYSPRRVFLACALAGAIANGLAVFVADSLAGLAATRFMTGFFLAGVYPVGMKIASGWYRQGLGAALGFMVGALVLGTGAPHLLRAWGADWPWQQVVLSLSVVAVCGGVLLSALVPDGPHLVRARHLQWRALAVIWRDPKVRASAFGYFGHMWELYAVLVIVPVLIARYLHTDYTPGVALLSGVVICAGAIGCMVGGVLAKRFGSAPVAMSQLAVSGLCCLLVPWMLEASPIVTGIWLLVWGITVSGDSPQFSALTAINAPRELVGSVLTLVNCIGFAISVVTIEAVTRLSASLPLASVLPWLAVGPLVGLVAMRPLLRIAGKA
ncbi:MAG: MFS transporter [Burkholderiaceae bacterium]